MRLSGFLYTPNNTGSPNYNICGQTSSVLGFANTSFKLMISQGSLSPTTIINTNDLSTLVAPAANTTTLNTIDVNYADFKYDVPTGKWVIVLNVYEIGTTNIITWEKFFVHIQISKSGYESYFQVFEVYGYDLGNATIAPYTNTGNPDFNIYLVNDTNNLVSGVQTKAFSKAICYRKPFTDEVYFYNAVGSQGTITYYNNSNSLLIGNGSSGFIFNNEDITIKERITLSSDVCESTLLVSKINWLPTISSSATNNTSCSDCSNNISPTTVSVIQDYSLVTPLHINGTLQFLSTYTHNIIKIQQYDYTNTLIDTQSSVYSLVNYAAYIASPTTYLVPITFTINTTELGDNFITACSIFQYVPTNLSNPIVDLFSCCQNLIISACNWFTIITGNSCNAFIFKNCSTNPVTIELLQLQDDTTLLSLITYTIPALTNKDLIFDIDGVYTIKVTNPLYNPSIDTPQTIHQYYYYTLPVTCEIQSCFLYYLNQVICTQPNVKCNDGDKVNYDFNAFIILFQTFMMLLNEELNYNYIYTSISSDKLIDLGTINDYITRLKEYCTECKSKCIPCASNS